MGECVGAFGTPEERGVADLNALSANMGVEGGGFEVEREDRGENGATGAHGVFRIDFRGLIVR